MKQPILLSGEGKLLSSTAACLLRAGHDVYVICDGAEQARNTITHHLSKSAGLLPGNVKAGTLFFDESIGSRKFSLVIVITADDLNQKRKMVQQADQYLEQDGILAVNLYATELQEVRPSVSSPARVIGLNWTEPAHTTFFLEIIADSQTDPTVTDRLLALGKDWGKDPHISRSGFSVRARLEAALTREALFLVANEYATFEDIDRNCRNDAGYYLPFVGNGRYMDLMGTSAYGVVMKDLNRHLSKATELDEKTASLLSDQKLGMDTGEGFFSYSEKETDSWKEKAESFSYKIHELISKYPGE